jgi:diguanylate cyclase (GGDEF)-like protein
MTILLDTLKATGEQHWRAQIAGSSRESLERTVYDLCGQVLLDDLSDPLDAPAPRETASMEPIPDVKTTVLSRRGWAYRAGNAWRTAQKADETVVVALVDIYDFKAINDTYGHATGDEVLRLVAVGLSVAWAPYGGLVARFGGDEFVSMLRPPRGVTGSVNDWMAGRADAATAYLVAGGRRLIGRPVKVNIGLAVCPPGPERAPSLRVAQRAADDAMYAAKGADRPYAFAQVGAWPIVGDDRGGERSVQSAGILARAGLTAAVGEGS